ncbi:MAG: DUF3618 domain-containing protein [Rhodobacterales bacterium]|nr:MAG: DUF3618 domain-containing protein [Rhodobacterales bacterium]
MDKHNAFPAAKPRSPAAIAAELEQDRAALARSIERLRDRLTPDAILDDARDFARSNVAPFAQVLEGTVRANPVTAVLVGAGMAWLALGRRSVPDASLVETEGETLQRTAPHDLDDLISTALHPAETPRKTGHMIDDRPLLAAGIGMAVGVAVGSILPGTATEDDLLGPGRDRLLAKAKSRFRQEQDKAARAGVELALAMASDMLLAPAKIRKATA